MDTEIENHIENRNDDTKSRDDTKSKLDDYISDEERQHLISEIHRLLIWVGESLPNTIDINGRIVEVHEIIWQCIHKKEFTDQEKEDFNKLIRLLETKEKGYEKVLRTAKLTHEEAEKLYHEIASITRAIMDIRECETGKVKLKEYNEHVKQKIEDTKRWIGFLKNVGRK